MLISATIAMLSQYEEKLPATRPDRMFSEAPPCSEEVTTSRTCRELVEVKTLTSSGMIAPAAVPQVMMAESFHHQEPSPAISGIRSLEQMNVRTTEMTEVITTSMVRGCS